MSVAWARFGGGVAVLLVTLLALATLLGSGGGGGAPEATAIITQPSAVSVTAGEDARFSVQAQGDSLRYQWQRSDDAGTSWADAPGATTAQLLLPAVTQALNGSQFRVQVVGTSGSVVSTPATLTVQALAPPVIVAQPADRMVNAGDSASFAVGATGTDLVFQWQDSPDGITWTDLAGGGATSSTLTVATAANDPARYFRVQVGNTGGNVTSRAAQLTVTAPGTTPSITTQPVARSVVAPASATFAVTAAGAPPLSYQWQSSEDQGTTFADIAGATQASYTTPATTVADSGRLFRVRVTNGGGSVLSDSVSLTVAAAAQAPGFSAQPVDQTVAAPATASFAVTVSGSPAPALQWQVSVDAGAHYTDVAGATTALYTTPATSVVDDGKLFRVVASNSAGTVASTAARLIVTAAAAGQALIYTVNNSVFTISGYTVDRTTGAVVATPGSPYAGPLSNASLVAHPNGRFLYAIEATQPRTWVYAIDPTDGRLTLTAGSPITTIASLSATIDPAGRYLIYRPGFQIANYAIDATTGGLTATGSVIISNGAASFEFSADSQYAFMQDGSAQLRVLKTNPLTLLTAANTIVPVQDRQAFYVRGGHLLVQTRSPSASPGLTSFAIDGTGGLTPVQSVGSGPNVVAHPNGRCFYLSGAVNGNVPSQSVTFTPVSFNATNGALASQAPVRVAVPGTITQSQYLLQPSPSGGFGYLSNLAGTLIGTVTPVALQGDACTIAPLAPFDPGPLQLNSRIDPTGTLLFSTTLASATLYVSRIDPATRVPTQVSGSPFATTGPVRQVVVVR